MTKIANVSIPTENDRVIVEGAIKEASNAMLHIDTQKDLIKDIGKRMKDEYEMPVATFNQLARMYHKQNKQEAETKFEAVTALYDTIFKK